MLDTSIASGVIAQRVNLDARLQDLDSEQWCISTITRAELLFGVLRRPEATKLARLVQAFLDVARVEPFDARAADAYAALKADLQRRGEGIGMADELIAAHALALGVVMVTDNVRHFERVPGLPVENWLREQ
jgi:tRNA(fMet)-specific endonuclease VapC